MCSWRSKVCYSTVKMDNIPGRGVKRKYMEEDNSHAWQRKAIIDMSMGKLRTSSSQRSEPCLRRSVLILNTLKLIETELAQEGVDTHQSTEAAINEIPEMSTTQLTLDPLPDISTFICPLPASSPVPMSIEALPGVGTDNTGYLGLVESSVIDLLPCKPLTGCPNQSFSQSPPVDFSNSHPDSHVPPPSPVYYGETQLSCGNVSQSSSVYYGTSSADAQSAPIAYYPTSSMNSEWELPKAGEAGDSNSITTQGPYHMSSNSSCGDECLSEAEVMELLHSLQEAADSGAAPNQSLPVSSHTTVLNAQCSTYCRSDSTLDDLESIMQILVGI